MPDPVSIESAPVLSVVSLDPVVISLRDEALHVLLRQRPRDSSAHPGQWALPGGILVDRDIDLNKALRRVMALQHADSGSFYMEQLHTRINHDPRGPTVSVSYLVLAPRQYRDDNQTSATWHPITDLPDLAFDHADIIERAIRRLRAKANYSILPAFLIPEPFTIPDLQSAFEVILEKSLDKSSFYALMRTMDALEPTGQRTGARAARPAVLHRLKTSKPGDVTADTLPTLPKNITR